MNEPPTSVPKPSVSRGWGLVSSIAAGALAAIALSAPAQAGGPDISAQRLLSSWQEGDPSTKMLAEVIASAFASGFSWGGEAAGKRVYCAPLDLKGGEIMNALERFLKDYPQIAEQPYGVGMAATLRRAFPCQGQ